MTEEEEKTLLETLNLMACADSSTIATTTTKFCFRVFLKIEKNYVLQNNNNKFGGTSDLIYWEEIIVGQGAVEGGGQGEATGRGTGGDAHNMRTSQLID